MPDEKICLKAVMTSREGRRVWSGEYACSICGQRFYPDPADPARLTANFSIHKEKHEASAGR
jgi:hypothetical protein